VTEEEINKHARRIAVETAYAAIENAANDWMSDVVGEDTEIPASATDMERRIIQGLAEDLMMDSVSVSLH